jgi:lysophospholipase L1-like esterase
MRRTRRIGKSALAPSLTVLFGCLLGLLLAETAVRVLHVPPPPLSPPRVEGTIPLLPLGGDLFVYRADSSFTYRYDPAGDPSGYFGPEGRMVYKTNNMGLRGPDRELTPAPGTMRILCLGDSYTFGEGVQEQDTYPARLEALLRAGAARAAGPRPSDFEVVNAGVQAQDTRLEALLLQRLIRLGPDLVIVGFFMNDAMPDMETIRVQEQDRAEMEMGRRIPSRLVSVVWSRVQAHLRQRAYLQSLRASFAGPGWEECRQHLAQIQTTTDSSGARLLVVIFPVLWKLGGHYPFADQHAMVRAECARLGCESLDLWPVYRGRSASALWAHPTDPHPNREAHALAALAIADHLEKLGWLDAGASP